MKTTSGQNTFVRGVHHHLRLCNGFQVYGWTAGDLKRAQAISELLDIANAGENVYEKSDVENYWTTKK